MRKVIVKTGNIVEFSGIYKPVDGDTELTFVEDNRVPPNNSSKLQEFVLVKKTKHKD